MTARASRSCIIGRGVKLSSMGKNGVSSGEVYCGISGQELLSKTYGWREIWRRAKRAPWVLHEAARREDINRTKGKVLKNTTTSREIQATNGISRAEWVQFFFALISLFCKKSLTRASLSEPLIGRGERSREIASGQTTAYEKSRREQEWESERDFSAAL